MPTGYLFEDVKHLMYVILIVHVFQKKNAEEFLRSLLTNLFRHAT